MKRGKLSTSVKTTVKVSPKMTVVKYIAATAVICSLIGLAAFIYLNMGTSEDAAAGGDGGAKSEMAQAAEAASKLKHQNTATDLDFSSYMSGDELQLLIDRNFEYDTIRKEYTSVKWNVNNSYSHLTLEVTNNKHEYSLEVFDQNGTRVLYYAKITDEKFFVDKLDLVANHEYNYLVKNTVGELYAGNFRF